MVCPLEHVRVGEEGDVRVGTSEQSAVEDDVQAPYDQGATRAGAAGRGRYARIRTGVPAGASANRRRISLLRSLMQPWETTCPIEAGSFVPCSAIGPPCTQSSSRTSKWAEIQG